MNPLVILGLVVLTLVLLAAVFAPLMWGISILVDYDSGQPFPIKRLALAVAGLIAAATVSVWILTLLIGTSNGSEHCGPGTHYLETGSGKYRSWICVAS